MSARSKSTNAPKNATTVLWLSLQTDVDAPTAAVPSGLRAFPQGSTLDVSDPPMACQTGRQKGEPSVPLQAAG